MFQNIPTWIKSGSIFAGIIITLLILVWITNRGDGDTTSDSFSKTRLALSAILEDNFTKSGTVSVPPIDPDADWLNDSADDPFMGPENAKIIIMEFSDFQCPFCKASFPAIREITVRYPEIKYIYRDWPVDDVHPEARMAAEAAACAYDQDLFWPYHDRIFQNQHSLTRSSLIIYARQTGLDMPTFMKCFDERKFANEVEQDRLIGIGLGVRGTPTWFINGEKVEGVIPQEGWEELLESL